MIFLNIFINNTDSGIMYILSKFADSTKMSCAAFTAEGKYAIQKDLERLEKLDPCKSNEVQQGEVKGVALVSGQSKIWPLTGRTP